MWQKASSYSHQASKMKELKERNKAIRKNYKPGQGGVIGKQLGVSRQRIHQIVHKKQNGFWGTLWARLRRN